VVVVHFVGFSIILPAYNLALQDN